jgi:methylase of polypeptide subunit release factors
LPAEYGLPIDEEELDRIDLKHRLYTMLLDEQLFLAPIDPNPQRILDLGTGSGNLLITRLKLIAC